MRRIVICADGTWNMPDQDSNPGDHATNVAHFARAVLPVDSEGVSQIVYYHPGVGTHGGNDKFFGGAFGQGVTRTVTALYRFLVNNYKSGDELYFVGFSRGAITVRILAGLVEFSGILMATEGRFTQQAIENYFDPRISKQDDIARAFRESKSVSADITFLGIWDAVDALGLVEKKRAGKAGVGLLRESLEPNVMNCYHALALDEIRSKFKPTLYSAVSDPKQTLVQKWFAGCHSCVGGGASQDGLSNIALNWMLTKASKHGIAFEKGYLDTLGEAVGCPIEDLSTSLEWMFFPTKARIVRPEGATNESIHPSVFHRMIDFPDGPGKYRPKAKSQPPISKLIPVNNLPKQHEWH